MQRLLASDNIRGIVRAMKGGNGKKPDRMISRRKFLFSGAAAFSGVVLWDAAYREPRSPEIRDILLPMPKVPPGREIRLVHLSDLHIRRFDGYFQRVLQMVDALEPEIILLTGDFMERKRNIRGVLDFLKELRATSGIFAVQGNWEYWSRLEGENLRRHFAGVGVRLLINERHDLDLQEVPFSILGLDYPSPADRLIHLQQNADPSRINLLLSHVPAFDHHHLERHMDLILSGHTHGGQVRLPFLPPLFLPRFSENFVEGFYRVGAPEIPLYVSRGIGTSVIPVRFFCRPEITLFRLHAE